MGKKLTHLLLLFYTFDVIENVTNYLITDIELWEMSSCKWTFIKNKKVVHCLQQWPCCSREKKVSTRSNKRNKAKRSSEVRWPQPTRPAEITLTLATLVNPGHKTNCSGLSNDTVSRSDKGKRGVSCCSCVEEGREEGREEGQKKEVWDLSTPSLPAFSSLVFFKMAARQEGAVIKQANQSKQEWHFPTKTRGFKRGENEKRGER